MTICRIGVWHAFWLCGCDKRTQWSGWDAEAGELELGGRMNDFLSFFLNFYEASAEDDTYGQLPIPFSSLGFVLFHTI
ncbi:uncharacterized protein BDW70DRAFT_128263 [Aspergillus foveolatus]|uniref:uncharacterized protein n=1 Tax=Aspergillus foveolatus TaxID=210207 RepID=UPI003CCE00FC